jgi:hypothetical protein
LDLSSLGVLLKDVLSPIADDPEILRGRDSYAALNERAEFNLGSTGARQLNASGGAKVS